MSNLRLGDVIDDYCIKCKRLTNHAIVSIVNDEAAKVRCRSCYHDHNYQHEQIPPSKRDLKKMELLNAVLSKVDPATGAITEELEVSEETVADDVAADDLVPDDVIEEEVIADIVIEDEPEVVADPVPAKKPKAKKKAR